MEVEHARDVARRIAGQVQDFVEDYTTVAVERTLCRFLGIDGVDVDLEYSDTLASGTRRLADFLSESMRRELGNPFLTPLRTQDGRRIGEGQQTLSLEQITAMDYLVENVTGSIPVYDELSPLGQATVDTAGVEPATPTQE